MPILVGITMWLQQKLNPPMPDPVQRKIFGFLPWVLMVIMAPFAAGLQLYWVTNNILSIAQQKWLYMRHPEMKMTPAPAGGATPPPPPSGRTSLDKPPPNARRSGGGKPKGR